MSRATWHGRSYEAGRSATHANDQWWELPFHRFFNEPRFMGALDTTTDHRFTGHPSTLLRNPKADGTGLMYYNARYYDPEIGQFISPDSVIPDLGYVFACNRSAPPLADK